MVHGEKPQTRIIDDSHASAARMYDWLLGGTENYQVDRDACRVLLRIAPSTQQLARNNRAFLRRIVRYLVRERGIIQFLDHGSGLPTQDNVHEIAQRIDPDAKVVYVDNDPMVLAHAKTYLNDNSNTHVLDIDFRDTEVIYEGTRGFLDWDKPIAALFVSVLHCVPDSPDHKDPAAVIRAVSARLAPGSCMVICQLVSDDPVVRDDVTRLMADATGGHWGRVRERDEVARYFDSLHIMEPPGLVDVTDWMPDSPPPPLEHRATDWVEWGGVGIVPRPR
ncbi:SAM-dependent methyltransferase [Streptomyces sp. NPDC048718]|uniref:SAM-dependent methyltransferase n=1 Tax=Streptomyces sp. NPDC048718 TaxID=3365587 RepID=UPI003719D613